jgi:hypothetical protein
MTYVFLLVAQSGRANRAHEWPLSGVDRTYRLRQAMADHQYGRETVWVNAALTRVLDGHRATSRLGDFAMLPEHRALLEDEPCPVPDEMLGELYRANAHGPRGL